MTGAADLDYAARGGGTSVTARPSLPVIYITDVLLARTGELLASFAERRPSEGVVYWFGLERGGVSIVTTLVVPDAEARAGCVSTSVEANAEALTAVVGTPLVLIGQAHSHPGDDVRHSEVDDRDTFARFDGAISVVVPYFARGGVDLTDCGVHRHEGGAFHLLRWDEISKHLVVLPGEADFRGNR
jgi:proteasome lid subunit RPN8/RPN11